MLAKQYERSSHLSRCLRSEGTSFRKQSLHELDKQPSRRRGEYGKTRVSTCACFCTVLESMSSTTVNQLSVSLHGMSTQLTMAAVVDIPIFLLQARPKHRTTFVSVVMHFPCLGFHDDHPIKQTMLPIESDRIVAKCLQQGQSTAFIQNFGKPYDECGGSFAAARLGEKTLWDKGCRSCIKDTKACACVQFLWFSSRILRRKS